MASALSASGIDCILISDSALFAVMSRVNKVIIGAHAGRGWVCHAIQDRLKLTLWAMIVSDCKWWGSGC